MFFNTAKAIYEKLVAYEYNLFATDEDVFLNNETVVVPLIKKAGKLLYIIFIINIDKIDFYTYDNIINHYKSLCDSNNGFDSDSIVFLSVFLTEDSARMSEEIHTEKFVAGLQFYNVNWIIDMQKKAIIVPTGEAAKILDLNKLINSALSEIMPSDQQIESVGDVNLIELEKKVISETSLKFKSNNSLLTVSIIIINAIVFMLMETFGGSNVEEILMIFGANNYFYVVENHEFYRLFTSMFLHIGLSHLAFNSMSLYIYGTRVEKYFGKVPFLIIYVTSGIAASTVSVLASRAVISAGASGAIFGLLGSLLAISLKTKKTLGNLNFYTIIVLTISSVGSGFIFPGVDNYAHIGGLISGFIVGLILFVFDIF